MRASPLTSILIATLLIAIQSTAQKKVVGYYPSWNRSLYPHTAIQYRNLTHIAHAFIFPYADGSLDVSTFTPYPELVNAAYFNNVKIVIAVGGWDNIRTPRFSQMAADTAARRRFVGDIVDFILTNGYDGVDLDWEYPKTQADKTNLTALVQQLRAALDATGLELSLSMAGPATSWSGQWFDFEAMHPYFDWIGVMTYDFYGAWTSKAGANSALYDNWSRNDQGWVDYSYGYYNSTRGVPKEKLLIGVPFYGQVFNASSYFGASTGAVQSTYSNIMPKLAQGWTRYWDSIGRVPYLINSAGTQVISYDDSQSVAEKCAYVNAKGSGGVIIWAIGQDQYQGATPLLETVGTALLTTSIVAKDEQAGTPADFALLQNFPNPFNPTTTLRYELPERSIVRFVIYNTLGEIVARVEDTIKDAGHYRFTFDASGLSSGVYFYRIEAVSTAAPGKSFVHTKKMLLLK